MNTTQQAYEFGASYHVTVLFTKLQERASKLTHTGGFNAEYQLGFLQSVVHSLARAQSAAEVQHTIKTYIRDLEQLNQATTDKPTWSFDNTKLKLV